MSKLLIAAGVGAGAFLFFRSRAASAAGVPFGFALSNWDAGADALKGKFVAGQAAAAGTAAAGTMGVSPAAAQVIGQAVAAPAAPLFGQPTYQPAVSMFGQTRGTTSPDGVPGIVKFLAARAAGGPGIMNFSRQPPPA